MCRCCRSDATSVGRSFAASDHGNTMANMMLDNSPIAMTNHALNTNGARYFMPALSLATAPRARRADGWAACPDSWRLFLFQRFPGYFVNSDAVHLPDRLCIESLLESDGCQTDFVFAWLLLSAVVQFSRFPL